jgi:methyltransferase (TIGR00027 family)
MDESLTTSGEASRTAMMVATLRGWHLLTAGADAVGPDWLAWPLVGGAAEQTMAMLLPILADAADGFPTWLSARAQVTEDWLVESGARQMVILGAGLDTYAWRSGSGVRVFEVDHPATQQWKRERVAALSLRQPETLTWVPVDFEEQSLAQELSGAGLSRDNTFVSWLGVVHYLTHDAIVATLRALPPCTLAVNYMPPRQNWPADALAFGDRAEATARSVGEAWLSYYRPADLAALLATCGFVVSEEFGPEDVEPRYGRRAISCERVALAHKAH